MKLLSIGLASQEAGRFMKREAGLLLPVALLFTGIPVAIVLQLLPPEFRSLSVAEGATTAEELPGYVMLLLACCPFFILWGTLTLYALALRPGVSLSEALNHALRRVVVAVGATLVMGLALMPLLVVSGAFGAALGSLLFLFCTLLLSARLLLLNAVVTDRPVGVLAALRESWALSSGHVSRLLAFVILISIPVSLAQMVGQSIFGLIGFALGGKEAMRQAGDVGLALVLAVGQMVMTVMTAFIYRQLVAQRQSR